MLTIGTKVIWQRNPETGEWKIRPATEQDDAIADGVARLDKSSIQSLLVPNLNRRTEFLTPEV